MVRTRKNRESQIISRTASRGRSVRRRLRGVVDVVTGEEGAEGRVGGEGSLARFLSIQQTVSPSRRRPVRPKRKHPCIVGNLVRLDPSLVPRNRVLRNLEQTIEIGTVKKKVDTEGTWKRWYPSAIPGVLNLRHFVSRTEVSVTHPTETGSDRVDTRHEGMWFCTNGI